MHRYSGPVGANFTLRLAGRAVYASPLETQFPYPNGFSPENHASAEGLSVNVSSGANALAFDFQANDRNLQLLLPMTLTVTCTGGPCVPPPPPGGPFAWIAAIEAGHGGKYQLEATTYLIDRQYQLPPNTELRGAGTAPGRRTVIRATGNHSNRNCGADAVYRKGFLLGDNTYIGGFHFVGMDTGRYVCLAAALLRLASAQTRGACPPLLRLTELN